MTAVIPVICILMTDDVPRQATHTLTYVVQLERDLYNFSAMCAESVEAESEPKVWGKISIGIQCSYGYVD